MTPWILCIHNIPPKPPYLRAKVARRLAALGAVAIKNAVYVLPDNAAHRDGLMWLAKEIEDGGGRAFVCAASFDVQAGGMGDDQIESLFVQARDDDYRALAVESRPVFENLGEARDADAARREEVAGWLHQLQTRFEAVRTIDFFGAAGREAVEGILDGAQRWLRLAGTSGDGMESGSELLDVSAYANRTWVTRPGIHVDRMASAWLIRRFIDPQARFRFDGEAAAAEDLRFDMPGAEFTHEGELCTFEVMVRRFGLDADPALGIVAAIIHDVDLDEARPARPESPGIGALINGITLRTDQDWERLEQGLRVFDDLLEYFRRTVRRQPGQNQPS